MVPLADVAYFNWDKAKGERIRQVRGSVSRRELADRIVAGGQQCSHQYIQKIEEGGADSVSSEIIQSICKALGASLSQIIPLLVVSEPK